MGVREERSEEGEKTKVGKPGTSLARRVEQEYIGEPKDLDSHVKTLRIFTHWAVQTSV
jgi:hypothetical protein